MMAAATTIASDRNNSPVFIRQNHGQVMTSSFELRNVGFMLQCDVACSVENVSHRLSQPPDLLVHLKRSFAKNFTFIKS